MKKNFDRALLADVAEQLINHLRNRTDVQNIDLMNLSGFCRNCLSKWYVSAAEKKKISISYDEAREMIYGMPYEEWKNKFQTEITSEQKQKFESNKDQYKLSKLSLYLSLTLNLRTFIDGVIILFSIVNS